MALEKPIIKSRTAGNLTFDYKPRELAPDTSSPAKSFVDADAFRSPDFKISDLVARQAGITQLENDKHQDKINAQVLERLGEVQEKAYEEGYSLGLTEGTEKAFLEAKADLLERLGAMEALLKRIEELKTQILVDNEAELIKVVFLTAKKMALRDLQDNREAILETLKSVMNESQSDEKVIVRLSAEDLKFLEQLQEKGGKRIENLKRAKMIADESIQSGGCVIETQFGSVNATVEERVDRTWQTLQGRVPQNLPGKKE